jgi:hypothetical protein
MFGGKELLFAMSFANDSSALSQAMPPAAAFPLFRKRHRLVEQVPLPKPFWLATDGGEIYRKLIVGKSVGFQRGTVGKEPAVPRRPVIAQIP